MIDKNNFLLVSFYTKNTGYEQEIKKLINSISNYGYNTYIEDIDSLGSWDANTKYKSRLLLNSLEKYPNVDLFLYLDSDAMIQKDIPLNDITGDISVHYKIRGRNGKWHKNNPYLLSGTIFYKNTQIIKKIFNEWDKENQRTISFEKDPPRKNWDQQNLQNILEKYKNEINIQKLTPEYCKIFDTMDYCKNPIIEHFQASRRFKGII
jgi:hypothetical protein